MKRKITLIEIDEGGVATLYMFKIGDVEQTEYEQFFFTYENHPSKDVQTSFDIIDQRITRIIENGAEDEHFRKEGKAVKALPFESSDLRLYCYRIDKEILIVGNGGLKPQNPDPKKNRTVDFPELYIYSECIRAIGLEVEARIRSGKIKRNKNRLEGLDPFEVDLPI